MSNFSNDENSKSIYVEQSATEPTSSAGDLNERPSQLTASLVAEVPASGPSTKQVSDEAPDDFKRGRPIRPRGRGVHHHVESSESQNSGIATAPPEHQPMYQPRHAAQLPLSGSAVGVGSLPGSNKEFGVALLPDERDLGNQNGRPYESGRTGFKDLPHHRESQNPNQNAAQVGADVHARIHHHFAEGLDHHAMSKWELPSKEEASGARCGVGSLPGSNKEAGVALLPDERHHHLEDTSSVPTSQQMPSSEIPSGSRMGVGSLPGKSTERGVALLSEERLHPSDEILMSHLPPRMDQMPSREHSSGSKVGVGSLPGKRSEQGVCLTPEERLHPAYDILMSHLPPRMDQMPSMEHLSGSKVGVGSLPGKRSEQGVALTPEERLYPANDILMSHLPPRMDQMPSQEYPSGSPVGVGSLPGDRNEKGVALLPEERLHPADQILMTHKDSGNSRNKPHGSNKYHPYCEEHHAGWRHDTGVQTQTPPSHQVSGENATQAQQDAQEQQKQQFTLKGEERSEMVSVASALRRPQGGGRVRSDLSPTAPDFVPHFVRGGVRPQTGEYLHTAHQGGGQPLKGSVATGDFESMGQPSTSRYRDRQSFGDDIDSSDEGLVALQLKEVEELMNRTKSEEKDAPSSVLGQPIPRGSHYDPQSSPDEMLEPFPTPISKQSPVSRVVQPESASLAPPPTQTTAVPVSVQREYLRTGSYAISAEDVPVSDISLSDKFSVDKKGALAEYDIDKGEESRGHIVLGHPTVRHKHHHHHHHHEHHHHRGHLVGASGVGFSMKRGDEGQLPGYPTPAGMSQLVRDRMMGDRARAAAHRNESGQTSANTTAQHGRELDRKGPAATTIPEPITTAADSKQPLGAPLRDGGISRVDSDLSTCAVRGSVSDLTAAAGQGTRVVEGECRLDLGALGKPLPPVGKQRKELHHGVARHLHMQRKGIN